MATTRPGATGKVRLGAPIWEHEPPQRRASPGLGRDGIADVAIAIADDVGLEGLTIRGVADRLGSSPMSLYRHVHSKEDLIDLMLDRVLGEHDLTGLPSSDWGQGLAVIAREQRAAVLRHPWSVLPPARPMLGPNGMRRLETALSIFDGADMTIEGRAWAIGVMDAFVRGSTSAELAAGNEQRRTGLDAQQWQRAVEPYVTRMLATGEYPMIAEYTAEADTADPDVAFEAGIRAVVSGIRAELG